MRRIHGQDVATDGSPATFATIYVPLGDAYAAFMAIWEQRGADGSGAVARHALEQLQGYWSELGAVDFDAGLADLFDHGWARSEGEVWELTSRGINLAKTRLTLP